MNDVNYLDGSMATAEEQEALRTLADYLVAQGKYKDRAAALKDAKERVAFLHKADIYDDDPEMGTASEERRAIHALIAAHHLHGELEANEGRLPPGDQAPYEPPPRPEDADVAPVEAPPPSRHSITEIFGAIEMDIQAGLEREQILNKLQESGVARDNAESAYELVASQKKKKQRTRLIAAVSLIILIVVLYFFAS